MGMISITNSNDSDHFSSLFSWPLDRRYQIWFYSITEVIDQLFLVLLYNLGGEPWPG